MELVDYSGKVYCIRRWKEAFGEFSSYQDFTIVIYILFIYIPVLLLVILYSFIFIKLKEQVHPGEHSSNIEPQSTTEADFVDVYDSQLCSVFVFGLW